MLDTGSSDLWIFPNSTSINLTNHTTLSADDTYGDGTSISGVIDFAEVKFGSYTVPSQGASDTILICVLRLHCNTQIQPSIDSFFNVNSGDFKGTLDGGVSGILGVSFEDARASPMAAALLAAYGNDTQLGHTVVTNIFSQNTSASRSFDILLSRADDPESQAGIFLVGEHLAGYEDVVRDNLGCISSRQMIGMSLSIICR